MVIPETFSRRGVRAISSYDYYDIIEGTGMKPFYLAQETANGTENLIMVQSSSIDSGHYGDENCAETYEYYPLTIFNTPKRIKGTAYINFAMKVTAAPTMTLILQKMEGATPTTLGSAVTVDTANGSFRYLAAYPITTQVHFRKGDYLRLGVKKNNATAAYIGTNPANAGSSNLVAGLTKSTVFIPFQVNL